MAFLDFIEIYDIPPSPIEVLSAFCSSPRLSSILSCYEIDIGRRFFLSDKNSDYNNILSGYPG